MSDLIETTRRDDFGRHVWFVPFQLDETLAEMFAAADVLLLNQLSAAKDTAIPSKLLTNMAAGRPVLAAVNPVIRRLGCFAKRTAGCSSPRRTRTHWLRRHGGLRPPTPSCLRPSGRETVPTPSHTSINGILSRRTSTSSSTRCVCRSGQNQDQHQSAADTVRCRNTHAHKGLGLPRRVPQQSRRHP